MPKPKSRRARVRLVADPDAGRAMQRRLFGPAFLEERDATTNEFNREARGLSTDWAFGAVWSHSSLALRERSMVVIAMLAALGKTAELKIHINVALANGFLTPDQLKDICLFATIYCGLPAGSQTTRMAEEVLSDRGLIGKPRQARSTRR